MSTFIHVILLAIVQGIAEFLPISSSAHLVFCGEILARLGFARLEEPLLVGVILHLASLLAILCYYWRPVARMAFGRDMRLVGLLVVATIPVGLVGVAVKVFFDEQFDAVFENAHMAGAMLLVTAGLLLLAHFLSHREANSNLKTMSVVGAFFVGIMQALAVFPGISRSGSTITGGLLTGLKRDQAATFSFLIAIPAILGAGAVEVLKLMKEGAGNISMGALCVGFVLCFVISLLSLHLLVRLLKSHLLWVFVVYLVPVGILMMLI